MFSVIFPGQGSQMVGMGKEFYDKFDLVKNLFKEADESLNYPLSKIILEGPKEELDLTANTQPAIFLISYAIFQVIKKEFNINLNRANFFAGHSLGEYSAIACAGYLDFQNTIKILIAPSPENEFAIKSSVEFDSKFRIIYCSFDNSRESWFDKVVLLANTNYINQTFLQNICRPPDTVTYKNNEDTECTRTTKVSTPPPKSNIKKKSHHILILTIAFLCFFSSCSAVGSVLYFKFPLVFQQVTELIFRSFS